MNEAKAIDIMRQLRQAIDALHEAEMVAINARSRASEAANNVELLASKCSRLRDALHIAITTDEPICSLDTA